MEASIEMQGEGKSVGRSVTTKRNGSLSSYVYETLKERILSFQYRPGQLLRKPEICEELSVSRAPVSEALTRLSLDTLVDVVPQSGTRVSLLSLDEIREAVFLREALELASVKKVASSRTEEQLQQISRNIRMQKLLCEDEDFTGFYQADVEFHRLIMTFTGFDRVAFIVAITSLQITRARRLLLPSPGRIEESVTEHEAIFNAIKNKSPQKASRAMKGHLDQLILRLEPLQLSNPEYFDHAGE